MAQTVQPTKRQAWIGAMRPRTLPLAIACIALGAFLAGAAGAFDPLVTLLCITTAIFLQILSNLANDYGDSVHGADSATRKGPKRAVQSGLIGRSEMVRAIALFSALAMVSGAALIWLALGAENLLPAAVFLVLGAAAIWAAINYTAGGNPYGYIGLGDLFTLIFFGPVGVVGAYFLQVRRFDWSLLLPGLAVGLFAVAVLNINNIRDIASDVTAGKRSIPVRLGARNARIYHWLLVGGGLLCATLYVLLNYRGIGQWLFILALPLLVRNALSVWRLPSEKLDPLLKQMVLASLAFVLTFGLGQLLA